jgi:hypothetical protein
VLGLHRVQLEVLAFNGRAIRCYLACGFRQEGVRREAELYPDGWKDLILMGILRAEYRPATYRPATPGKQAGDYACSRDRGTTSPDS